LLLARASARDTGVGSRIDNPPPELRRVVETGAVDRPPPVAARLAINARPVARNIGLQPGVARDDSGRPNRQLAASASQKNGKAKHPRPAARNDTLPLW
jgi:hypothetical protein